MSSGPVAALAGGFVLLATLALAVPPAAAAPDAGPPAASQDDGDASGDAVADRSKSRKTKKKAPASSKPATPAGPDARPAPRPSSGDHARPPSPVQPRATAPQGTGMPRLTPGSAVRGAPERSPAQSASAARRASLAHKRPVPDARRPYEHRPGAAKPPPPWHRDDHRYARPNPYHVRPHPHAHAPPPAAWFYRPWYTHWWVHPYWRYTHASWVVVHFDFLVYAWTAWWVPPARAGWVWVPGYWTMGYWHPGHWRPIGPPPVRYGVAYVYVPGWWQGDIYIEGYWRPTSRPDGDWIWVDGYYLDDGTYVAGHWRPAGYGPEGYVWEPGFFDGQTWVGGFWRPEYHPGYVWVSGGFDDEGIFHAGYWEPIEDRPGQVWVPGWFDGTQWIQGYWVTDAEYQAADPTTWQPEEGWNDGWQTEESDAETGSEDALPLALPVDVE